MTAHFGAASSVSQSRWGGGSIYFNGGGQYLTVADNAALELGESDFAIELWLRTTQTTAYATLVSRNSSGFGSGSWSLMLNESEEGSIALHASNFSTSGPMLLTSGVSVTDGAWHHVAWVRNGTQHSLYVDGVRYANVTSSIIISDISSSLAIGTDLVFSGRHFFGFIDDLRYTVGRSRYSGSTITVPTAAFNTFGPMSAPTSLSVTGGNTQVSLAWTAPSYNGGSTITGYVIEYTPAGGSPITINTGSSSVSYLLTGLTNGTAYVFRVAATNSAGTVAYTLASSSVTPSTAPVQPSNLSLSFGGCDGQWSASWTASPTAGVSYLLTRNGTTAYSGAGTSASGLGGADAVTWRLVAVLSGAQSTAVTVSTNVGNGIACCGDC